MKYISVIMVILLCSCGEEDFTKASQLGELRVLGITADVPEVDGTSSSSVNITLTPYISDLNSGGRTFKVTVLTCIDPGIEQGSEANCENPNIESYPGGSFDVSTLTNSTGAMTAMTITLTDPAAKIAPYSTQQRYNGVNYLVIFKFESGGTKVTAVKTIPITDRGTLNNNPVIQEITFDGVPLSSSPDSNGQLNITYTAAGSPETYNSMSSSGAISSSSESYLISWFYMKGKVSPSRVIYPNTSKYTHDTEGTFVGVVRDLRGGTAIKVLTP